MWYLNIICKRWFWNVLSRDTIAFIPIWKVSELFLLESFLVGCFVLLVDCSLLLNHYLSWIKFSLLFSDILDAWKNIKTVVWATLCHMLGWRTVWWVFVFVHINKLDAMVNFVMNGWSVSYKIWWTSRESEFDVQHGG